MDPDHIFVGDRPPQQGLPLEPFDHAGPQGQAGTDHLESDRDPQFAILGLVDSAHPSTADFLDDRIAVAKFLSGSEHEGVYGGRPLIRSVGLGLEARVLEERAAVSAIAVIGRILCLADPTLHVLIPMGLLGNLTPVGKSPRTPVYYP